MHISWKIKFILLFIILLSACAGLDSPERVPVDYSSSSSVLYEVSEAQRLLNKSNPVKALVKAKVLQNKTSGYSEVNNLYIDAIRTTREAFDKAIMDKRWNDALVYFRSLASIDRSPSNWSEQKIYDSQISYWQMKGDTPLVNLNEPVRFSTLDNGPTIEIIAKMIKGTVTVWVDRGLKVEKGVAFADRIIGSGFFIDNRGYFITNYHVIKSEVDPKYEGYSRIYIKHPEDSNIRVPAKVVGWDPVFDLALIKTELKPKTIFQLGSSKDLSIGSKIYAIGSPAGLEKTLTSGIVSAKNRRFFSLGSVLQIDAAINHGNSGGPLIDEKGNVQAVVFAGIESNEGLNFAIPVELLRLVLPHLYSGGKVQHSWMGCFGHDISQSELKNLSISEGVFLDYVLPLGPSYDGGIVEGSIITKFNGVKIASVKDLQDCMLKISVGTLIEVSGYEKVEVEKYRKKVWYVMLDERPELPGTSVYTIDAKYRALLPLIGMNLESAGRRSYRVKSVITGSIADEVGFLQNDYVEIKKLTPNEDNNTIYIQLYAKRRKVGYLEGFMGVWAYLDGIDYF